MGGQGQLNVYSYALDRESECLLTTSPLSKLILFGLLPAYQNGLSHVPRTFFFFLIFEYPLLSFLHATFFLAVSRKLISRVNMHYS